MALLHILSIAVVLSLALSLPVHKQSKVSKIDHKQRLKERTGQLMEKFKAVLEKRQPHLPFVQKRRLDVPIAAKRQSEEPEEMMDVDLGYGMCATFGKYSEMAVYGYNTDKLTSVSVNDCLTACAKASNFICRSADYNPSSMNCYLSSEDRHSVGSDFSYNGNTDNYHFISKQECGEQKH